jgi:FtsP/CotA-like multicopper oxidase with cupredoxin domain
MAGPISRSSLAALSAVTALALTACGGGSSSSSSQQVAFNVRIKGATMTPATLTAHQNDNLTVTFTADRAEEIHLHGYNLKFETQPGKPQSKTFKAVNTGSFEIEIEDSSTHLGELDVYPR